MTLSKIKLIQYKAKKREEKASKKRFTVIIAVGITIMTAFSLHTILYKPLLNLYSVKAEYVGNNIYKTSNGQLWEYDNDNKNEIGDKVTLEMDNNYTESIYDDRIISIK